MIHKPVLVKEVLEYLAPKPGENMIDATVGQAGHTLLILEKTGPDGEILGIDLDQKQIENSRVRTERDRERVILVHDSYANVKEIVEREHFKPVNGMLMDLGYSSWQIENSNKGFSFSKDEPLDMRYNLENPVTARKIVNEYPEAEIKKILDEYGEEIFAGKIAKKIIEERKFAPIESTFQLKSLIEEVVPKKLQHGRIHCATKSFQALRIAVNGELDTLEKALPDALSVLEPGGRLVVISFHSLEDRIVKDFFKEAEKEKSIKILTKKPVTASEEELMANPRARSAKLRAIIKNGKVEVRK
ncbi:16S rRNA (cytosine(1402)-N(4))-methyltransferase RsmH [Candidatus Parcubacteria bacterium]|nr:16S rRNA (cytosine(1402)-N(4))-methyltransferase RsmH [Candidatus Parcubacteria bacterium]